MKILISFALLILPVPILAQVITCIAGQGTNTSDHVPATDAMFSNVSALTFDKKGNLYFSNGSDHRIRKIGTDGIVTIVAGTTLGFYGDGGPATDAKFNQPNGVTTDTLGNVYIADGVNNRIRKIDVSTGIIYTVVGSTVGFSGDGGPASAAQLKLPCGITFDKEGNLYIEDAGNGRIRKVNGSGIITTIAGTGVPGWGGSGGPATDAQCFPWNGIVVDNENSVYFSEVSWGVIRKIDNAGIITTIAGDTTAPHYYNGDEIPATNARIDPNAIAVSSDGSIYISDSYNNRIRRVGPDGIIHTIAGDGTSSSTGDGGLASSATVYHTTGITLDTCGNLYFGQVGAPRIRKIALNPECLPISVPQITADAPLSIHPNPATNHLSITYAAGLQSVTITDMLGRTVLHQTLTGQHTAELPLQLSPGCYTIIVNQAPPQKLIIQ